MIDGSPFIVMELLEGEDLRRRLDRERVLPLDKLESLVAQSCKALGQAHRAGIVHRDIKPENIFLCKHDDGKKTPDCTKCLTTCTGSGLDEPTCADRCK